jgi:hypothetical protein
MGCARKRQSGDRIYYDKIGDLSYAVSVNPPTIGSIALDVRNGQTPNFSLGRANGLYFPPPPGLQIELNPADGMAGAPVSVNGLSPSIDSPRVQVWNL